MDALQRYALLTVGDGLVSQIPALLISTATGIVVTRAASDRDLGQDVFGQLTSHPRAIQIAAAMLLALGLVPGLPKFSFLLLAAGMGFLGWHLSRKHPASEVSADAATTEAPEGEPEMLTAVDRLSLQVGYGLIGLLEDGEGPGLLSRITALRRQLSRELGMVIPPVRVRDDFTLSPNEYVIQLRDSEAARGMARPGALLAVPSQPGAAPLPGDEAQDPVFGLKAWWIQPEHRLQAETREYTVVEPAAVLTTHLSQTIRDHAASILSRQDVADLIEQVRASEPAVVTELIPDLAGIGQVHQALRQLLDEGLSVRDLPAILEALSDGLRLSHQLQSAVEYVRMTQAEAICERLCDKDRIIRVASLSPGLEALVDQSLVQTPEGSVCALPPGASESLMKELAEFISHSDANGQEPVLLTSPHSRPHVRGAIARTYPQVRVISYAELAPHVRAEVVKQLGAGHVALQAA